MVFPAKYRRKVFSKEVEQTLIKICVEISERYEINFIEIGNDEDHIHFLIQGIPTMSVSRIVQIVKSLTARELFSKHSEIKKKLWTRGFYANTVGQYGSETMIKEYVKNQGKQYTKVHSGQLKFDL